jgi:hypothetical protein
MQRAKYIEMRNKNKYDLNWFYNYFLDNGGMKIDSSTFGAMFQMMNLNEVLTYLDSKLAINRLEDKNGNLIKILE